MDSVMTRFRQMWVADDGQDLIEYALLGGLIAVVATAAITSIGTNVNDLFLVKVSDALNLANK
jgi:Flp pilus assembly pilin Flp